MEYSDQIFKDISKLEEDISFSTFENCKFINCSFSALKVKGITLIDCEFINSKILGIDWSEINQSLGFVNVFKNCDLSYSVFINNDLRGMELHDCKVKESTFENCNLHKCVFERCNFQDTRFISNDLSESDFRGSYSYIFDIVTNNCKKAKFDSPEVLNLLRVKDLVIE